MRELILACLACSSAGGQPAAASPPLAFDCRDRNARYVVSHHLAGDELGVEADCAHGPQIRRWRIDRDGHRREDTHRLSAEQFDQLWQDVDATGWTNLHDCAGGAPAPRHVRAGSTEDPVYRFTIRDDRSHASFACRAKRMPFPYSAIVDPLDLAAQHGQRQLGDDEPPALAAPAAGAPRR